LTAIALVAAVVIKNDGNIDVVEAKMKTLARSLAPAFAVVAMAVALVFGTPSGPTTTMAFTGTATIERSVKKGVNANPFARRKQQQQVRLYSSKDFIFSDGLTRLNHIEREYDDIVWRALDRKGNLIRNGTYLAAGAGMVAGSVYGATAFERWARERERKDIEEEIERTGRYVSVDASAVDASYMLTDIDDKGEQVKHAGGSKALPIIPGSIMIQYEIAVFNKAAKASLRQKAESSDFDQVLCEGVQMGLLESTEKEELKDETEEGGLLHEFQSMVMMRVGGKTALQSEAGVLTGRLYLDNMRDAAAAVVNNYTNVKTRDMMLSIFTKPIAEALTLESSQVVITSISANTDVSMGQAGRMRDGKVRNLLKTAAPSFLRWFEQSSSMDDDNFWETKTAQSIDAAPIRTKDDDDGAESDGSGDSPAPGDFPDPAAPDDLA
jgi:hypothetical protein